MKAWSKKDMLFAKNVTSFGVLRKSTPVRKVRLLSVLKAGNL
ncbi:hypothetical protein FHX51_000254 [Aeriscardovia aeriphila]|uniref:Uncharacterized protein n=1 Tax=Aeriscardovia aeriphila TaxID=218139 RepID=A0A261FBK6_9BIFI|nr:hypothetical protein [Aeriscardovia aeriphila]OZG56540.1 hypothetical protein AEAE_1028 [Aeriscardovia aeriphila]